MKKPQTRKMKNSEKNRMVFWFFFTTLTLTQLVMYISNIGSEGYAMHSLIYNYYNDSFMDFFNPFNVSRFNHPYEAVTIGEFSFYSPLYILIFRFLTYFSKSDIYDLDKSYLTHFSETMLIFIMFAAISTTVLAIIIYNNKKGNVPTKIWFLFLMIFSAPMIYNYERGSLVILAVIFVFLYMLGFNNEKPYIRHLSLLALALAVCIKPYAIIFLILLLRDKKFKEALFGLLYTVLLWLIPSFFIGGPVVIVDAFSKFPEYIKNIWAGGAAYRTDIFSALDIVSMSLGYNTMSNHSVIKYIIWAILVIGLIVCAFISKSLWKRILALSIIVIAAPFAELETSLLFLIPPLMLCLDSEDERKAMDMVHIFLFIVVFAPLVIHDCIINFENNIGYEIYLHSYIVSIAIILFILMLLIETVTMPLAGIELNDPKPEKSDKPKKEKKK
ncbi:MAG: DUF2029 domain-containing protein [Lachnospiraceae bacterium]|nr:DUF2029 domain-containing protein [Lachnospiraceae bacterium]